MSTIYLLCRCGENHGEYEVFSWGSDKDLMESIAIGKEWADYRAAYAKSPAEALSPDQREFRRFFVQEVHAQPEVPDSERGDPSFEEDYSELDNRILNRLRYYAETTGHLASFVALFDFEVRREAWRLEKETWRPAAVIAKARVYALRMSGAIEFVAGVNGGWRVKA